MAGNTYFDTLAKTYPRKIPADAKKWGVRNHMTITLKHVVIPAFAHTCSQNVS